jgi:hypothetical protein
MENDNAFEKIIGFENYAIDKNGVVQNRFGRPLKIQNDGRYCYVKLYKDGEKLKPNHCLLHRLLGIQFIPNPENKPTIDHIDRNKLNNDLSNLRWATHLEQHANMTTALQFETEDERRLYENKRKNDWRVKNKLYLACAKELRQIEF